MRKVSFLLCVFCMSLFFANAQRYPFNGLDMNMGNLSRLSDAKTRSISPENFTGEKGKGAMADPVKDKDIRNKANSASCARDLGKGWKVNPYIIVKPGETFTIAEIEGPGAIQQIWMTPTGNWPGHRGRGTPTARPGRTSSTSAAPARTPRPTSARPGSWRTAGRSPGTAGPTPMRPTATPCAGSTGRPP